MLDNWSTNGELLKSASHFAHCNEKAFEVAFWKQTILQTKEMDLKNIAEGTTDPRFGALAKVIAFESYHGDCESFARRTFTTPKIRTITTPKFGHFPPPQKKHLPGGQLPPPFFFLAHFSWLFRLTAHGGHQGWE